MPALLRDWPEKKQMSCRNSRAYARHEQNIHLRAIKAVNFDGCLNGRHGCTMSNVGVHTKTFQQVFALLRFA